MHNTILGEHVRLDDLRIVDKDAAVADAEAQLAALDRLIRRAILDVGAVNHKARNDVVSEHGGQLLDAQACGDIGDGLEGFVRGREESELGNVGESLDEIGLGDGPGEGAQLGVGQGLGEVQRDGEDAVDDVDGA